MTHWKLRNCVLIIFKLLLYIIFTSLGEQMKCLFHLVAMGVMGNKLMNEVKVSEEELKENKVDYKGIGNGDIKNPAEQFNIPDPSFYAWGSCRQVR